MQFDKRKSGISLIDDLPWGSHFCQFYQNTEDLGEILMPFFRAGLENNEFCVWVTPDTLGADEAEAALGKAVPHFGDYARNGQIEIIPAARWYAAGGKSGRSVVSRVDKAVTAGFDGLRLACNVFSGKKGRRALTCYGTDVVSRYHVIGVFTYPRDEFDAIGLMDVVKNHRFALLKNAGRWEIIESSGARTIRDALKRSEEELQSLFSNMSEGFAYHRMILDDKGNPCDYVFLNVNEAFERLTGLRRENIVGKKVTEALPGIENDDADWIGRYGKVALTEKPDHFDIYSERLGKWYSISAFCPHKGYFAVTFSDITERKQALESLASSEERFRSLAETASDAIISADSDGKIFFWNRAAESMFGYSSSEAFGRPLTMIMPGRYCEDHEKGMGRFISTGMERVIGRSVEFAGLRKDGVEFPLELSLSRWNTRQGLFFTGLIRDITERKWAEEEIMRLNEELKQHVIHLEAANKELESFSYSVSHDLRAPLRSINGFSQQILEDCFDKLDDEGKDAFQRIRAASQRMGLLIDGLLNLSRLSRSGIVFDKVDLSELAGDVIGNLKQAHPERNIETVVAEGLSDEGDERLIYVLLQNLLGNAWKFTERVPKARLEFGSCRIYGETIYFVRDNGVGFDMAYADKLFRPFQRLHGAAEFPGTGIGLATVQRIINRHGGRLWAEGEVGKGATFYFTLK